MCNNFSIGVFERQYLMDARTENVLDLMGAVERMQKRCTGGVHC